MAENSGAQTSFVSSRPFGCSYQMVAKPCCMSISGVIHEAAGTASPMMIVAK
jgi:hypothetical protein